MQNLGRVFQMFNYPDQILLIRTQKLGREFEKSFKMQFHSSFYISISISRTEIHLENDVIPFWKRQIVIIRKNNLVSRAFYRILKMLKALGTRLQKDNFRLAEYYELDFCVETGFNAG